MNEWRQAQATTGTTAFSYWVNVVPAPQPPIAPVAAVDVSDPIAWLKERVREVEWRP